MSDLSLSTDSVFYLNARDHWRLGRLDDTVNHTYHVDRNIDDYHSTIVKPFHDWLKLTQHCIIFKPYSREEYKNYGVDSYNVAVGTDRLVFDTEQDLNMFVLRWGS